MEKIRAALNALKLEKNDIQREDDDKYIHIKGYGCHFGVINKNGEMVNEESFASFFKDLEAGSLMPVLNYQHQPDKIIGCWDKITADETGLLCEGRIFRDVQLVKDTIEPLMNGGALDSLSTEGWVTDWEIIEKEDGSMYLFAKEFVLTGISLVALPADFDARIDTENALTLERAERIKKTTPKKNFIFTI